MVSAKRLKQRRAGCMAGIVSIFDFRHGRFTGRLLSDHTMPESNSIGPSCSPTSEVSSFLDSEEMHQQIQSPKHEDSESAHTRVNQLMEDEMQANQTEKISKEINFEDLMSKLILVHEKSNEEPNPKSFERSNSLDHKRTNLTSEEPVIRKNRNFLRRRSKSHECISFNANDTPPPSHPTNGFKAHHARSASQFSFQEIKKKLKNAIAKSSRDSGCREKPAVDGNSGWSSPNRDHFFSERFCTTSYGFTQDVGSRLCRSERELSGNKEIGDMSDRVSSIYIEAKKHLYDLLKNEDECVKTTDESHSRTLGKLLAFPGYNSSSSDSGHRNELMVGESQLNVTDVDRREPEVSNEVHQAEGLAELSKPLAPEEIEILEVANSTLEDRLSCSPIASPSRPSLAINSKSGEVENTPDDRTGKPSPVSVLEPLFSDDDISPARTISRSAESSIQPLRIRFEEATTRPNDRPKDQETCILNQPGNEESVYEYIEAVLLASDLNWADFEQRWLSSARILDPSLYHELQIFSSRPVHDQRFLFDATNDILTEVCDCCLDFFPGYKPYMNPIPKGKELINMVWERFDSRRNCCYPRSLDQLIKKDFERSGAWIDLHLETREIVMDIEESMIEDMIDDTVVSLLHC